MNITIHQKEDFEKMQNAGLLAAEILDFISEYVQPGVTTEYLNDLCHKKIIENNAIPASLNYKGFPKSICTSINHVVCHGIPCNRSLKDGDIINIDITVILDGWHGDTSRMYWVGKPSIIAKRLTKITYEAMMLGIQQVKPGNKIEDIAIAIEEHAHKNNFSVVYEYCGHGIGKLFHCMPQIFHATKISEDVTLEAGMFFTIEPMINIGRPDTKINQHDNWTVTTKDRSLSAQFEHSIGVTEKGCQIFTLSPTNMHYPPYK